MVRKSAHSVSIRLSEVVGALCIAGTLFATLRLASAINALTAELKAHRLLQNADQGGPVGPSAVGIHTTTPSRPPSHPVESTAVVALPNTSVDVSTVEPAASIQPRPNPVPDTAPVNARPNVSVGSAASSSRSGAGPERSNSLGSSMHRNPSSSLAISYHPVETRPEEIDRSIELLKKVSVFRTAPEGFLKAVAPHLQPTLVDAGVDIVVEGDYGNCMFFLVKGKVQGTRRGKTFYFNDGDFFGEVAVLRGTLRTATCTSLEKCDMLVLTGDVFLQAATEFPSVRDDLEKVVLRRFEQEKYPSSTWSDPDIARKIDTAVEEQFARLKAMAQRKVKFRLNEKLGSGASGTVYAAINTVTGLPIAVKVIHLPQDSKSAKLLAATVEQESAMMQRLQHPNLVQGFGFQRSSSDPNKVYILMELAPLGSLNRVLQQCGRMSEIAARNYIRQGLLGLQYLHRNGVLHRDIKPSNMLLAADGTVKLADFGISILAGSGATQTNTLAGTPAYMSPDAICGRYSVASDIWAVGCSLLELVTGELPWSNLRLENSTQLIFHIATCGQPPTLPPTFTEANTVCRKFWSPTSGEQNSIGKPCGGPSLNGAMDDDEDTDDEPHTLSRKELLSDESNHFSPVDEEEGGVGAANGGRRGSARAEREVMISPQLASLLLQMLAVDPKERGNVPGLLSHDWFIVEESQLLPETCVNGLWGERELDRAHSHGPAGEADGYQSGEEPTPSPSPTPAHSAQSGPPTNEDWQRFQGAHNHHGSATETFGAPEKE